MRPALAGRPRGAVVVPAALVPVRVDAGAGAAARAYRDYRRFADSIVRRAEGEES